MADKKNKKEKKYHYTVVVICKECETVAETIGPCVKCGCQLFLRMYPVVEDK